MIDDFLINGAGSRRLFIQFLHPGGEHIPDHSAWKNWNQGSHRRKFMVCQGSYLVGSMLRKGQIVFWGEWEPFSIVERIDKPVSGGPHWLHWPLFEAHGTDDSSQQNTDPFVFGPHFHYAVCRQLKRNRHVSGDMPASLYRPTELNGGLACGSIILFGSHIRGRFVLDTVFVVAKALCYHPKSPGDEVIQHVGPLYKACVIDRLGHIDSPLTLYCGATHDDPFDGMYSFFPCMPYTMGATGFPRPAIELLQYVSPGMRQGFRSTILGSADEARLVWNEAVRLVTRQGLAIGLSANIPGTGRY